MEPSIRSTAGVRSTLRPPASAESRGHASASSKRPTAAFTPAKLTRGRTGAPLPAKFIALAQYEAGFADRSRWPILWPHIHQRPTPPSHEAARRKKEDALRVAPRPATLARRSTPIAKPQAPQPPQPCAEPTLAQPAAPPILQPSASTSPPTVPSTHRATTRTVRRTPPGTVSAHRPPAHRPAPQAESDRTVASPPIPAGPVNRAATVSAWDRVCRNPGVQRALAVGKLAADGLDLLGASLASYITGPAILDVVIHNLKADWQQLVQGGRLAPAPVAHAPRLDAGDQAAGWLMISLYEAREHLKSQDPLRAQKLNALRRAAWGRGLMFAASLFMIGASGAMVAVNPAIGGVLTVLSVYAARQAYANWRLARANVEAFRSGDSPSPMGSNALGHVLNQAYLQDSSLGLTPEQAQLRAARRATAVGAVSMAASVAMGGVTLAVGATLPAALSGARHAVRGVGLVAAPVVDVINSYTAETRTAHLARQHRFEEVCGQAWTTFFAHCPQAITDYETARAHYEARQAVVLPRPQPMRVQVSPSQALDIGPLVRWTLETRRVSDLPAWLALDRALPQEPRWAQRLFEDLRAIDESRVSSRGLSLVGAATSAAASGLSLAL